MKDIRNVREANRSKEKREKSHPKCEREEAKKGLEIWEIYLGNKREWVVVVTKACNSTDFTVLSLLVSTHFTSLHLCLYFIINVKWTASWYSLSQSKAEDCGIPFISQLHIKKGPHPLPLFLSTRVLNYLRCSLIFISFCPLLSFVTFPNHYQQSIFSFTINYVWYVFHSDSVKFRSSLEWFFLYYLSVFLSIWIGERETVSILWKLKPNATLKTCF